MNNVFLPCTTTCKYQLFPNRELKREQSSNIVKTFSILLATEEYGIK